MANGTLRPIGPFEKDTVNGIFLWRQERTPDEPAYWAEDDGGHRAVTYRESKRRMGALSLALRAHGVGPGDRTAVLADVRHEWMEADGSTLLNGSVTVGIYPMSTPEQAKYILDHCAAKVLFIDTPARLTGLASALAECSDLQRIVLMDSGLDEATRALLPQELDDYETFLATAIPAMEAGGDATVRERALQVEPADTATLVYTSGTTGPPKGAVITHANLFYVSTTVHELMDLGPQDLSIVYLPLAHILMRYGSYLGMLTGVRGYYWRDVYTLPEALEQVRPTVLVAVPRVLEKIYAKANARADSLPERAQKVFHWAFRVGREVASASREGHSVGLWTRIKHRIADRIVLSKVRTKLGGRIRLIVSGGAPLARHISEWFHAAGMLVIEGYGLTETSAPATTNLPEDFRFGGVGRPIPGTEIRIADDGEILIRGPGVFSGYYRDDGATGAAFTEGHWFHSGDIGELDTEGHLRITDRKKDILITAGGKNVAPANIENLLKEHGLIGQAMVYGDRKPFLTCVLTVDPEEMTGWFADRDIECPEGEDALERICTHEVVLASVKAHIEKVNGELARFETIKKWKLLPVAFDVAGGYLTPTMKMKRRVIAREFESTFEGFYTT